MISAEAAHEATIQILKNKNRSDLQKIMEEIDKSCVKGNFYIVYELDNDLRHVLEYHGFLVVNNTISWACPIKQ